VELQDSRLFRDPLRGTGVWNYAEDERDAAAIVVHSGDHLRLPEIAESSQFLRNACPMAVEPEKELPSLVQSVDHPGGRAVEDPESPSSLG